MIKVAENQPQPPGQTPGTERPTQRPPSFLSRIPLRISSLSHAAKSSSLWNPLNSSTRTFSSPTAQRVDEDRSLVSNQIEQANNLYDRQAPRDLKSGQQSPSSLQVEHSEFSPISSNRTSAIQLYKPRKARKNRNRKGKAAVHQTAAPSIVSPPMANPPLSSATSVSNPNSSPNKDLESGTSRSNQSNTPAEIPWGPSHPCFPHPNPHVPLSSPLYASSRIIRIRRDWMIRGDLAPCFSNIYPEILEPWVSEQDFRILIRTVNDGLIEAFKPEGWRAWGDAILGLATGWLWEDLGFAAVKGKVRSVEAFVEEWNAKRASKKDEDGEVPVKAISLRRTGYLSVSLLSRFSSIPSSSNNQTKPNPTR